MVSVIHTKGQFLIERKGTVAKKFRIQIEKRGPAGGWFTWFVAFGFAPCLSSATFNSGVLAVPRGVNPSCEEETVGRHTVRQEFDFCTRWFTNKSYFSVRKIQLAHIDRKITLTTSLTDFRLIPCLTSTATRSGAYGY